MGLVHVYYGNGPGKTTGAFGLGLRALGYGRSVTVVQFLKNRSAGEIAALERFPEATVLRGCVGCGFPARMTAEELSATRRLHDENLRQALARPCDLLILDEAMDALETGLVEEALLRRALTAGPEVCVTGHRPVAWLLEAADYVTEMICRKHPYEKGVAAREGVEY